MAQTKTIQLLRSSQLYTPTGEGANAKTALENAKAALTALTGRKDGEIVLARYQETEGSIKSVLGIYHTSPDLGNGQGTDGADATYTSGWTFIQDVTESEGSAAALQQEIDTIESNVGLGTDGTYTSGYSSDEIVGTPTTLKATVDAIVTFIKGLDKAADAQNGQVVTTVTQTNGAVTETKANVKDLQLGGYSKDTSATGAIGSTDTVNTALSKLENAIEANDVHSDDQSITVTDDVDGGTNIEVNVDSTTIVKDGTSHAIKGNYTLHALNSTELAALNDNNVKEAYQLQTIGGSTAIGDVVKIYKDSALQEVYLGASTDTINASTGVITKNTVDDPQSMNFAYQLADGTYSLTKIDVSKFLTQSEFGDGLSVSNAGVVSVNVGNGLEIDSTSKAVNVKIDSTSETFLTVGADGVKLDGVQDAIDAVKVTTDNTGATYVNLAVDNATGRVLTLTNTIQAVSTADSSNQGLAEASDVKDYVDSAVANKNVSASGDNYVSATASNNEVTVSTDVQTLTFTQGSGSTDSTLSGTAQSLADGADIATKVSSFTNARISEEIAKLDSSVAATAEANNQYSVLTGVTETDGKLTAKTEVTLAAVAKTGAAADVSVTDTAGKLTATNVEDALAEIVDKADASLNSVSSTNGAIAVGTKDANKNQALTFQIGANCAKEADGTTNMLTIENDGLVLSNTWDCGTF